MAGDVKWIKINVDMFNDDKIKLIESMPEADSILIVWIKLLSQAGKTNASGYIYLNQNFPYNEEMLATLFNRKLSTVRMALKVLREFQMIDIDERDFLSITNWDKHQNIDGMEKIREQNRLRKQKEREKKKLLLEEPQKSRDHHGTVTENHATERERELELELEKELKREREEISHSESKLIPEKNESEQIREFKDHFENTLSMKLKMKDEMNMNDLIIDIVKYDFALLNEALKITKKNGKKNYAYFERIVLNWYEEGIKTFDEFKAQNEKPSAKRSGFTVSDYENA